MVVSYIEINMLNKRNESKVIKYYYGQVKIIYFEFVFICVFSLSETPKPREPRVKKPGKWDAIMDR